MNYMKNIPVLDVLVSLLVSVVVVAIGLTFFAPKSPLGASTGPDHYGFEQFFGGVLNGTQIATSSQGSETVTANEFVGWAKSAMVSFSPGLTSPVTITFPASSTVSNLVPHAGDVQRFCIRNATTTAAVYMTLAGSTGINLLVASSSATALGGTKLLTGKVGCITLVREASTASTFDIDALLTVFQ